MKYPIVGYLDQWSVQAGNSLQAMLSARSPGQVDVQVVRIRRNDPRPGSPDYVEDLIDHPANRSYSVDHQPVYSGSWCRIPTEGISGGTGLGITAWIWPTLLERDRQVIVHCRATVSAEGTAEADADQQMAGSGSVQVNLVLLQHGTVAVELGIEGKEPITVRFPTPVQERCWYRVHVSIDPGTGVIRLGCVPGRRGEAGGGDEVVSESHRIPHLQPVEVGLAAVPLFDGKDRMHSQAAYDHFNGKIADPSVSRHPLPLGGQPGPWHHLLGRWDFSTDMEAVLVKDTGPNHVNGRLYNFPTRAMTGPQWDATSQDPRICPSAYNAIHFHEDDIGDCGWEPTLALDIPSEWGSGVYALRLRKGEGEYYLPFVVRPALGAPTARAAVLLPTGTYQVYGNHSATPAFGHEEMKRVPAPTWETAENGPVNESTFGRSAYFPHQDGSGISVCSRLRPVVEFRPKFARMADKKGLGVDKFGLDLYLLEWLNQQNIAVDVITDEDLHREGYALIEPYSALITGCHPEYVTDAMFDALEAYQDNGGRLMYLGGNGFYLRIAFHPDHRGILEIRRGVARGLAWEADPGEEGSAFDGAPMGEWNHLGRPARRLVGVGFSAQCTRFDAQPFVRTEHSHDPRAAFIFENVDDEVLGDFGVAAGGAAGHELDRSDYSRGTPAHALVIADATDLGAHWLPARDDLGPGRSTDENTYKRGEIVFFETAAGGAVFSAGSNTYIGSLTHNNGDNNISTMTRNVLLRFLDAEPFHLPTPSRP